MLGAAPSTGRPFLPDEFDPGSAPVLVLSHGFWQRRFGGRADIVGQSLVIDGELRTVVGVMGPNLRMVYLSGFEPEFLAPLVPNPAETRAARNLVALARLRPGISASRAEADLNVIARVLEREHAGTNTGCRTMVTDIRGNVDPAAYAFLVVLVLSVLGVVCANAANLLLAWGAERQRELTIRAALGASRLRLVRQLMTESTLLVFLASCLGVTVTALACGLIRALSAGTNAAILDLPINLRILGVILVVFLLAGLGVGAVPALNASRVDLGQSMKETGSTSVTTPATSRLRSMLVASQVAVSIVMLAGAVLVIKSWSRLWNIDPGFRPEGLLVMKISLPERRYPTGECQAAFFQQLLARLASRPGLLGAGAASSLPTGAPTRAFRLSGSPAPPPGEEPTARLTSTSVGYFETLGVLLKAGRVFTEADSTSSEPVAIVNEAWARRHAGGGGPVGMQIEVAGAVRTVVGMVGDQRTAPLRIAPAPEIFVPHVQSPGGQMWLVVRTSAGDPLSLAGHLKREIAAVDPNQAVDRIDTMDRVRRADMGVISMGTSIISILGIAITALAAIGLYGLLSHSIARRTAEIGIRVALGARDAEVMALVLRQGLRLVLVGLVPGLAASAALERVLRGRIYGLSGTEPLLLAGITMLMLSVALLACILPARRAARIDPATALRCQ
jgi:putative ABC transport system permease protein